MQSQNDLFTLANLTETFSKDIYCMKFGIDKCKINSVKAGQIQKHNYVLSSGDEIEFLDTGQVYKYLGYNQLRHIQYKETKAKLVQQFRQRF
jgi:hypothetical protein